MRATRAMTHPPGGLARSRHMQAPRAKIAGTRSPDLLPDSTHFLQRYLGNSALQPVAEDGPSRREVPPLQRACACGGTCAGCAGQDYESEQIHPKLIVGQPGDIYEREADQVAETVMRLPAPPVPQDTAISGEIQVLRPQHLPTAGHDEVRRQPLAEEEDTAPLQAKEISATSPAVPPDLAARIDALRGSGEPLPATTRAFFEPRFGYDFSRVRVHSDARAAEVTRSVHARAFTVGRDVVFGAGQYAPGTTEGQRLLAHELTHVVQQNGREWQRAQTLTQGVVMDGNALSERDAKRIGVSGTYGAGIDVSGVHSGGTVRHELGQAGVARRRAGVLGNADKGRLNSLYTPRFEHDFSRVRVHTGAKAAESARPIDALAGTVGHNIVVGARQQAQGTWEGKQLLAHEFTHTLQQNSGSALTIQRAPAPGSHGNVGGCQLENLSEEDSGTLAHHQVATHSELVKQMGRQVPGRWIPRASKDVKKDCPTTSEAGPGASDLFFYGRPWVFMAEIKSINQPDLAVQEYQHYAKRIIELVARFHNDGSVCSDYVKNGANGADVDFDERHLNGDIRFSVDYGLDAEGAGVRPAPVTDAMVPSRPVDAGVFPDPRIIRSAVARTKRLFYENQNNGGVVYWCNATEEDKDKDEKSREEPEPSDTSEELQQEGSTLDYALNCVVEGVLGEIVHDPSMCGILLDSALSLIPYVDQAADIRDTLAHLYWILYRGEYDNPSRWVAVAFTLVGYLPEAGSAIKSTSKIGEKAIREGLQKIDDFAGPQLRKIFAAENLDAVLESIMKQQSKWKADGIELFNKGLDELEYRLEQALSAAALLARMTGFGAEAIVKLIKDEIARIQKLMADAPEMLNEAFDEVFARITRTIEALKREPVDIHPPTSAAPVKAPATPSTSAPRRPVGAAQQELFERH